MEFKTFTAGPDDNDRRLDRIIRKFVSNDSLSSIYKSIRKGLIKVNDSKSAAENHIFTGDKISIASFLLENQSNKESNTNPKETSKLEIIFQNEHLIIINKPYDITVQGDKNSLNKIVEAYYRQNFTTDSLSFTPGPLHRLDRKTSGLLCFSASLQGARWFSEHISNHSIKKIYCGILQGKLEETQKWNDFIEKRYQQTEVFQTVKVTSEGKAGKKAITEVSPVSYGKYKNLDFTLASFNIETGRTHQIRAQSAFHGYPLLGDRAYGGQKIQDSEYFLHAEKLIFPENNPLSLPKEIIAPLSEKFSDFLKTNSQYSI